MNIIRCIIGIGVVTVLLKATRVGSDTAWSSGWDEGFACGVGATDEEVEKVYPPVDDEVEVQG